MTTDWFFLNNVFDNTTKNSVKKMNILATDHHDKLLNNVANPDIQFLYGRFLPIYQDFKAQYQAVIANTGMYEGHTQIVASVFSELSSTKIKYWDIQIQGIYIEGTPEYKMLLPNMRGPFQTGGYESRIRETRALALRLHNFPALSAIEQDVTLFADKMEQARTTQQGYEKATQDNSALLEEKRLKLAKIMHANFGRLIDVYIENLAYVENYYELQYLRADNSSTNTGDGDVNEPDPIYTTTPV